MGSMRTTRRTASLATALAAGALLALACATPQHETDLGPADASYELRGEVQQVRAGGPRRRTELTIHHQSVPGFVDREGKVVGMDSMTMPFPVARGVSTTAIAPGDKVAFRFEVRWNEDPVTLITSLQKLPPDTAIDYRPAAPPAASGATPDASGAAAPKDAAGVAGGGAPTTAPAGHAGLHRPPGSHR